MGKLKPGDPAPDFQFIDHQDNQHSLEEYRGKKVILYFYPRDNTPGCTAEACNLRDNYSTLKEKGFEVIGISADSMKSHAGFRAKYDLPFHLVSDKDKVILEKYGAWGEKKMMGRTYMGIFRYTFVIDEKGIIEAVFEKVNTKNHTEQILEVINL